MSDKKTLILEYDDFHWKSPENCLDSLYKFIALRPDIKITLFTTPLHSGLRLSENQGWCNEVRKLIESNNIRLAVHGTFHEQEEYKYKTYQDTILSLEQAEKEFQDSGLPFIKVFRGPHWGVNSHTYTALSNRKYSHIYTHIDYFHLIYDYGNLKSVIYNWNLKDESPKLAEIIIGHGHTHQTCGNGINETFDRVRKFIDENHPNFKFANEI